MVVVAGGKPLLTRIECVRFLSFYASETGGFRMHVTHTHTHTHTQVNQFAYTHGHMEGVQSAAEIENGNFDAQQHFKAMLMYQEMIQQYLTEHESRIELIADRVSNLNTTACTVAAQGSSLR